MGSGSACTEPTGTSRFCLDRSHREGPSIASGQNNCRHHDHRRPPGGLTRNNGPQCLVSDTSTGGRTSPCRRRLGSLWPDRSPKHPTAVLPVVPAGGSAAQQRSVDDGRPIVYWRPGCRYCLRLRVRVGWAGQRAHWVNIWTDPIGAAAVRAAAWGNETAPTVVVGELAFVNPDPK
jgi:hypothetical protein